MIFIEISLKKTKLKKKKEDFKMHEISNCDLLFIIVYFYKKKKLF